MNTKTSHNGDILKKESDKRDYKIFIIIGLVLFGFGFALGYTSGFGYCIDTAVRVAKQFDVVIPQDIINKVLGRYGF